MKGLSQVYGYEIYQYSFFERGQTLKDIEKQPDFIKEIIPAKKVSIFRILVNILCDLFSKDKKPLQCLLFYSKSNVKKISDLVDNIKPDVIIVDMIRLSLYIDAFYSSNSLKVANLDDLLSTRYKRQLASSHNKADISGNYGKRQTGLAKKIINLSFIKKSILKSEIKRLEGYEKQCYTIYDKTMFVSEEEKNYLNHIMNSNKACTVTVGIDYDYYSQDMEVEVKEEVISFLGNMNVAANIDSLDIIIKNIFPLIKANVTLKVVGLCPNNIRRKYKKNKNVFFTGFVDDVRSEIGETALFLSPIAYGSGIKTKILEAMAMGKTVVTNSVGVEGIAVDNGKHIFVYDDYVDIASCVDTIIKERKTLKETGNNAQVLVKEKYQWEMIWQKFENAGIRKNVV